MLLLHLHAVLAIINPGQGSAPPGSDKLEKLLCAFQRVGTAETDIILAQVALLESIAAAEGVWNADPSSGDGEESEQHERKQHGPWALMNAMRMRLLAIGGMIGGKEMIILRNRVRVVVSALSLEPKVAKEGHVPEAEHVERGDRRGDHSNGP